MFAQLSHFGFMELIDDSGHIRIVLLKETTKLVLRELCENSQLMLKEYDPCFFKHQVIRVYLVGCWTFSCLTESLNY